MDDRQAVAISRLADEHGRVAIRDHYPDGHVEVSAPSPIAPHFQNFRVEPGSEEAQRMRTYSRWAPNDLEVASVGSPVEVRMWLGHDGSPTREGGHAVTGRGVVSEVPSEDNGGTWLVAVEDFGDYSVEDVEDLWGQDPVPPSPEAASAIDAAFDEMTDLAPDHDDRPF